jgi:hypothetical protein
MAFSGPQKIAAKHLKPLERVKGIEPSYSAWKAAALPLSYTRARGSPNTPCGPPQPAPAAPDLPAKQPVPRATRPVWPP